MGDGYFMRLNSIIDVLTCLMRSSNVDALFIGNSSDLEYLTGMSSYTCERFKALVVLEDRRYFYISPELYYEETREALGKDTDIFVWDDSEGFLTAIEEAGRKYALNKRVIGVNDGIRAVDLLDIKDLLDVEFVNGSPITQELRIIKTEEEKDCLRRAAQIADETAGEIVKFIRPKLTEKEISDKITALFAERGAGLAFESIVASGPNTSRPHYNGCSRIIEEKDIIILDFGCKYKGFCSDISRTVFIGEPSEEQINIYNIVLEANRKAEAYAKMGVTAEEIDLAARNIIRDAGYGQYFLNRTGHGIGSAVHEGPYIRENNKEVIRDGMAFSVEPGIYMAGRYGMRVEDIVLINDGKAEVLNKFTKEMIVIK